MRTLTFSQARGNLKQVLDRVEADADVTIITRRDAADAVVMSLDTFNSWKETLHLLSSPANARRLDQSIAEHRAGKARVHVLEEPEPAAARPVKRAKASRASPMAQGRGKAVRGKHR